VHPAAAAAAAAAAVTAAAKEKAGRLRKSLLHPLAKVLRRQ
jgi:hypothetical protein